MSDGNPPFAKVRMGVCFAKGGEGGQWLPPGISDFGNLNCFSMLFLYNTKIMPNISEIVFFYEIFVKLQ